MSTMRYCRVACVMFCAVCSAVMSSYQGRAWADVVCDTPTPIPSSTATPTPSAEIVLNGEWVKRAEQLQATFQLNESISQAFKAYAVIVLPDGKMLNALTLDKPPKPVVANKSGLPAPFTYPLINRSVPKGAPLGNYEVMAGFFNPQQPVTGSTDAFLLARRAFHLVTDLPTPTPTATPIPNLTGPWSGQWQVTEPIACDWSHGTWEADVTMAADGKLSGSFFTPEGATIVGLVAGYYDGTTAAWTVCDPTSGAVVSYSGQVLAGGTTVSGTFWDGPDCSAGQPTSGTFSGLK